MSDNNNQNENGFEAYIEKEFQEEVPSELPDDLKEKYSMKAYLFSAFVFVAVLIVLGVTSTYAYYASSLTSDSASQTTITATSECFDVVLNGTTEAGSDTVSSTLSLGDYNYPIIDDFAVQNLTPMTVSVTNRCQTGNTAVPYKLIFTTFNDTNLIPDEKIKVKITRQQNVEEEESLYDKVMLNTVPTFANEENSTIDLKSKLAEKVASLGTPAQYYTLDSATISANTTNTYKIYVWIDYLEGCQDASCNGSTAGKTFKALVSAVIN